MWIYLKSFLFCIIMKYLFIHVLASYMLMCQTITPISLSQTWEFPVLRVPEHSGTHLEHPDQNQSRKAHFSNWYWSNPVSSHSASTVLTARWLRSSKIAFNGALNQSNCVLENVYWKVLEHFFDKIMNELENKEYKKKCRPQT